VFKGTILKELQFERNCRYL